MILGNDHLAVSSLVVINCSILDRRGALGRASRPFRNGRFLINPNALDLDSKRGCL